MSKQLALVAEGKRLGLIVVLAALLAALAAVGAPMWSGSAHAQSQGNGPYLCNGLYHVDAAGNLIVASTTTNGQIDTNGEGSAINGTCTPAAANDINNNIISYDHMVCAVGDFGAYPRVSPPSEINSNPSSEGATAWSITTLSGTPNVVNSHVYTGNDRFDPENGEQWSNGSNLYCVQWTSTQTGEQNVVIKNNHQNIVGDYADGGDPDIMSQVSGGVGVPTVVAPIKEWNVLSPTTITTSPVTAPTATEPTTDGTVTNTTVNGNLTFNPATSSYLGYAPASGYFYENVWSTHTPNQVAQQWYIANGAAVTFTNTGTTSGACAALIIGYEDGGASFTNPQTGSGSFTINGGDQIVVLPGASATVTSIGVSIPFYFSSDPQYSTACTQTLGSNSGVSITVAYPGTVGSNVPTFPAETLNVNWQTPPAAVKQVLLAWAGQTVVLEHDWRIAAGDYPNLDSAGYCSFGDQDSEGPVFIKYVRQNGPGSFVGGLDAVTLFSDGGYATVAMSRYSDSQEGDAPGDPQDSCISRVLYESEDQGEVDVVAYQTLTFDGNGPEQTGTDNQTTYPFVIYYMNLNTVNLTTVDATKPTHNSSTQPDWSPSNPWDASAETDSTTSNVSQDVLVRGRVTGWFTNSIPSGRAADSANHLPADRWVMPDDWAELAGGSLGTSFRPSYDLMFSPSNTGLALTNPQGDATKIQVAVALDGSGTGYAGNQNPNGAIPASPILVADKGGLYVGQTVNVGSQTERTILAIVPVSGVGYGIILSSPVAKPAAGTPIYGASDGVPFEGPYSLIDIPGLAISNGGVAGAALSNIAGTTNSATRDTVLGDGQIDWWDAPMPPANISVSLRGSGFIKQVIKSDVYYLGAANADGSQTFPNPYYISNIPASPFLPANVAGGNYLWDSWGQDGPAARNGAASSVGNGLQGTGPYAFWSAVIVGGNELGIGETLTAKQQTELTDIRADYGDDTIARDLTIFSDNHGEFMVAANGDFNLDYSGCATNSLGGGHECKPGDAVGTGTVTAVADYPMLKKHAPIGSNAATIDWTWGGYKSVTIEHDPAGNAQFVYVVFHALDRDGHCGNADGAVLLHSALTGIDAASATGSDTSIGNQVETVDFKIDSGDGIVLDTSGPAGTTNDSASFATGVYTYSLAAAKAKVSGTPSVYFDPDPAYAADGQTDECQAWIKVSNSLLGQTNVLTIAHDDEGNIGFDRVLDFQQTQDYTLNFRWTLFTWAGADNIPVADALAGGADTKNPQGNDITDQVTAVYGWQADSQTWLGYFPSGVDVPGANDLTVFHTGEAYWIAIKGPSSVTWTITTNVS